MSLRVLGTALKLEDYAEEGEGLRTYVAKGAGQEERRRLGLWQEVDPAGLQGHSRGPVRAERKTASQDPMRGRLGPATIDKFRRMFR